jgi:hypothetical protein
MLPGLDGHVDPSHSGEFSAQVVGYVPGQALGAHAACAFVQIDVVAPYLAEFS